MLPKNSQQNNKKKEKKKARKYINLLKLFSDFSAVFLIVRSLSIITSFFLVNFQISFLKSKQLFFIYQLKKRNYLFEEKIKGITKNKKLQRKNGKLDLYR